MEARSSMFVVCYVIPKMMLFVDQMHVHSFRMASLRIWHREIVLLYCID